MTLRKCSTCLRIKPISEFSPKDKAHIKYMSRCKPCTAEWFRLWRLEKKALLSESE